MWADRGFYKRAQILPADLALAGVAQFADLDRLTLFADNLVPHVLRCDGVLSTATRSPRGSTPRRLLAPGPWSARSAAARCTPSSCSRSASARRRACSTCGSGTAARTRPYKARPRHRCRCVFY